jgi:hypothetical protein
VIALGIVLAAVGGFVLSGAFYALAPAAPAVPGHAPPRRPAAVQAGVELVRSAVVAALVAGLMAAGGFAGAGAGALLGLALWALPLVLLAGSVFHEGTTVRAAATHGLDWLLKLVAIGTVVGLFA